MKKILSSPKLLFITLVLFFLCIFFLFPINLFDGEIIYQKGLVTITEKRPISLSYFIGMGYDKEDMEGIKDFYLVPIGYLIALIFIVGIPALIAYRVHLGKKFKKEK
jgi:hypothetical protein